MHTRTHTLAAIHHGIDFADPMEEGRKEVAICSPFVCPFAGQVLAPWRDTARPLTRCHQAQMATQLPKKLLTDTRGYAC